MRRSRAQWCVQMNGFLLGTCVMSYQSPPYKERARIPATKANIGMTAKFWPVKLGWLRLSVISNFAVLN